MKAKKDNKADQKNLQEKYMEFQLANAQIQQIQKQLQLFDEQTLNLMAVVQNVDEIGNVNAGSEILVPFCNGIFARAELKDNETFIVNVGGDIAVEKNAEDTKELLNGKLNELAKQRNDLLLELQNIAIKAQTLEKELNELIAGYEE